MNRRDFLGCAVAAAVPLQWRLEAFSPAFDAMMPSAILDLGPHCSLAESLVGYAAALGPNVVRSDATSLRRCDTLIVPAAVRIPAAAWEAIWRCLDDGGRVILESGAGFANEADVSAHRAALREALDIQVDPPVDLWTDASGSAIPYVDFTWPTPTKVRDFSRVVPLAAGAGEVIARVRSHVVGIKRRVGSGTLVVLGSPIGPALWVGDVDAKRWLRAC